MATRLDGNEYRAAELFGAADGLRAAAGCPEQSVFGSDTQRQQAAAPDRLGDEVYTAAFAAGRAMSFD